MKLLTRTFVMLFATLAALGSGCVGEAEDPVVEEDVDEAGMTFEEFEARTFRETETGYYIVDGDVPILTVAELREFYEDHVRHGDLIVHRSGGTDVKWSDAQKNNLTYCVSTNFGSNYSAVVQAMASATGAWESAANVDFIHRSDQDSNCTAQNTNVVFDVRPVSGQRYLARAFFPNTSRSGRNILIDTSSFGNIKPWSLTGILRHETGHTIGFRHEHTRPEAGVCFEDTSWRALTSYDSGSVMHYPQCNGTNNGDLSLTNKDKQGAAALYP